jgi:pimeloyl-ACP methyl ester carboxylesterase
MSAQDVRSVTLPQGRVAYRETGSGDPLLFIHGWPVSSLTWRKVIPALAPSYRCIAVDLMGIGESQNGLDGDFSMPAQARMLAAFLDALELPSATLIAHDSGATIARILAADQPQRVPRLILFDTEIPGHVIPYFVFLQKVLRLPGSDRLFGMLLRSRNFLRSGRFGFGNVAYDHSALDLDELFDTTTEPMLRSRDHLRASLKFFVEFDWHVVDAIPHDRLTMPKLVLWGDHDAFFPYAKGRQFFETLPEPKSFSTIADCGLFPHEERPAEWLAAVEPFLAETPA